MTEVKELYVRDPIVNKMAQMKAEIIDLKRMDDKAILALQRA